MITGDDMIKAVGLGATIAGVFATAITWIVSQSSKGQMQNLSPETSSNLRTVVDNLVGGYTRAQIDSAEIKKDIQHILEKMEIFQEQREADHAEMKKLSRILYPLLKDEIAAQRKSMGLINPPD